MIKQTWALYRYNLSYSEIMWLTSVCTNIEYTTATTNAYSVGGHQVTMVDRSKPMELTTITEQSATLLKLRYGDDCLLVCEEWHDD